MTNTTRLLYRIDFGEERGTDTFDIRADSAQEALDAWNRAFPELAETAHPHIRAVAPEFLGGLQ